MLSLFSISISSLKCLLKSFGYFLKLKFFINVEF